MSEQWRRQSVEHRVLLTILALIVLAVPAVVVFSMVGGSSRHAPVSPSGGARPSSSAPRVPPEQLSPEPSVQTSPRSVEYGATVGQIFNAQLADNGYPASQVDLALQALRSTGATIARAAAPWEASEPDAPIAGVHRYDWTIDDRIAGELAAHRLHWLLLVGCSPEWARIRGDELHSPPRAVGDYAAYAAALASRYGPGGAFWRSHPGLGPDPVATYEIWNEPDSAAFWSPRPEASRYVDLYLRARDAIKVIDPAARVIVGGLTSPGAFLRAMIAARPDLRAQVDGIAVHPYARDPDQVVARTVAARQALQAVGLDDIPLYVTEVGWATRPPGAPNWASERVRPAYLAATVRDLGRLQCGIAMVIVHAWMTSERSPSDEEDWYGLYPPHGSSSADVSALRVALAAARTSEQRARPCGS